MLTFKGFITESPDRTFKYKGSIRNEAFYVFRGKVVDLYRTKYVDKRLAIADSIIDRHIAMVENQFKLNTSVEDTVEMIKKALDTGEKDD